MNEQQYPLKVCYFGTYRANYSRNQIMIAGLRANKVDVVECHVPLWHGIEDRVETASGGWASLSFVRRLFSTYINLLKKYLSVGRNYDVMILGYPGQLDTFLARLLTWVHHKPLVLDMFMSVYLVALERRVDQKSKLSVRLLHNLEWLACRLPNLLVCDTEAYRDWYCQTYNLQPDKIRLVPTGADDRVFKPIEVNKPDDGIFRVLYYGTFIPNHGVRYIIEAANLLKDHSEIQIELVGQGPDKTLAVQLVKKYNLQNVTFTDWIEKEKLPQKIAEADVLLGVFGATPQSLMTVQNKIYEGLAMKKPIITGDSPVIRSKFGHKKHLYLCQRADIESLAEAILELRNDENLRNNLDQNGQVLFNENYTIEKLGMRYVDHLQKLVIDSPYAL